MKMNEMMTNVGRFAAKAKFKIGKHSPEILMVCGAVGAVASAVMACKATLKVNDILEDRQTAVEAIHNVQSGNAEIKQDAEYTEEDAKKDLTTVYVQTGVKLVKLYAPAVILGGLSLGCMIGSNHILQKRNAALTAAYVTLDKAFTEYKERVTERFGDRVQHEIEHGVKAVEIENKEVHEDGTEELVKAYVDEADGVHSPYDLLFDEMVDRWEPDYQLNKTFLSQVQSEANRRLRAQGYLFLNDVYRLIGGYANGEQIRKPVGQIVGWLYDPNDETRANYVNMGIDAMQGDRSVVLHFNCDGPIIDKI